MNNVLISVKETDINYGCFDIPDDIIVIADRAFERCTNLEFINIRNGIETIGHRAFWGCEKLVSVIVPDSVTTIGDYAFGWCNALKEVRLPKKCEFDTTIFIGCVNLNKIL